MAHSRGMRGHLRYVVLRRLCLAVVWPVAAFATTGAARLSTAPAGEPRAPISCHSRLSYSGNADSSAFAMLHTADGFLLPAFIAPSPDTLWLLFDSGAGRTLLSREAADRLRLHATAQGTIHGVGSGAVAVSIVPAVTLALPGIRLDSVDLRLTPKSELSSRGNPSIDGIIGYDLLCTSVVTVDFGSGHVTVLSPRNYHAAPSADVLPLLDTQRVAVRPRDDQGARPGGGRRRFPHRYRLVGLCQPSDHPAVVGAAPENAHWRGRIRTIAGGRHWRRRMVPAWPHDDRADAQRLLRGDA